jgi:hypothetical protein
LSGDTLTAILNFDHDLRILASDSDGGEFAARMPMDIR